MYGSYNRILIGTYKALLRGVNSDFKT